MSERDKKRDARLDMLCEYIAEYHEREGISPTVREIQRYMGVSSTSTAYKALRMLKQQGRITMIDKCPRTIRLLI